MPVPVFTLNGWQLGACAVISHIGGNVFVRTMEIFGVIRAILIKRNATAAVMSNAARLMNDLEVSFHGA